MNQGLHWLKIFVVDTESCIVGKKMKILSLRGKL